MRTAETAKRLLGALALALFCAGAVRAQQCNAPMKEAVSFVPLPGHPFSTVSSPDGCWLFVSVASSGSRPTGRRSSSRTTFRASWK